MNHVAKYQEEIRETCSKHYVDKLYLFGSATNDKFNESSDIDLLVKFLPFEREEYFNNFLNFKSNLEALLKRKVDLLEEQALKNPVLINSIAKSKSLIYG
jgi:predicted nucleotidyltransferase